MNNVIRKKFIYFFLFPFFSSLTALKNIKSRSSILIIIGFFLLFGLSFNPVNEKEDSFRYAEEFREFQKNPDRNFQEIISNYTGDNVNINDQVKDIYVYLIYYISSKIGGNNIHILFFLFALVFTFFCVGSLKYIINNRNFHYSWAAYILLFLFFYSNSIYNINGVRFWTASWAAVYISFHILIDGNKKWIFAFLFIPLIHIGFIVYIAFFLISYLFRSRTDTLFKFFIISFFLGQVGLIILDSIKGFLPPLLQNLIWSYTQSEFMMNKVNDMQNEPMYVIVLNSLPRYYELLLLFLVGYNRNKLPSSPILGFTLCFFSIINLFAFIPSLGTRYYLVAYPFIVYLWIDNLHYLRKSTVVLKFVPIIYAYRLYRWIRNVLLVTPITLYVSNFFHLIIKFIMS